MTGASLVSFTGLSLVGDQASDYALVLQRNQSATLSAKVLTQYGLSVAVSRTYDGTIIASIIGSAQLNSLEAVGTGSIDDYTAYSGDTVSFTGIATARYNIKDVTGASLVSFGGLSLAGSQASDYSLIFPQLQSAAITPKALTEYGLSVAATRTYDGTIIASIMGSGTLNKLEATGGTSSIADFTAYSGDTISFTGQATATYNIKDVTGASVVSFGGLSLAGSQASDYTLIIQDNQSAVISTKTITEFGLSVAASRTYDGTIIASIMGSGTLNALEATGGASSIADYTAYSGDTISLAGTASVSYNVKDVTGASLVSFTGLSLVGNQASDYALVIQHNQSSIIVPKVLTEYGLSVARTRTYDGTIIASVLGSAQLNSFEVAGSGSLDDYTAYSGDTLSFTGVATATYNVKDVTAASVVSFGGLSLAGAQASDYSLVMQRLQSALISAKTLTQTGLSVAASRTYDGTLVATVLGSPTLLAQEAPGSSPLDNAPYSGDTLSLVGTAEASYNSSHVSQASLVTFNGVSLVGTQSSNYQLVGQAEQPATIDYKNLTVVANNALAITGLPVFQTLRSLSGEALSSFRMSYYGFIPSEGVSNLVTLPVVSNTTDLTSPPGSYVLTPVGPKYNGDYVMTYLPGTLYLSYSSSNPVVQSVMNYLGSVLFNTATVMTSNNQNQQQIPTIQLPTEFYYQTLSNDILYWNEEYSEDNHWNDVVSLKNADGTSSLPELNNFGFGVNTYTLPSTSSVHNYPVKGVITIQHGSIKIDYLPITP